MKITVKQDRSLPRAVAAFDGMGKGQHCIVLAVQQRV
jgi:hypothetical protein